MHEKIVSDILNIVHKGISEEFYSTVNINPETLNTIRTERFALSLGILTILKLRDSSDIILSGQNLSEDINQFTRVFPSYSNLLGFYNHLSNSGQTLINNWYINIFSLNYREIYLSIVYESLLSYEWVFDSEGFHIVSDKSNRNRSGSYYTPESLADVCVRKVLDELIEQRLNIPNFSFEPSKYQAKYRNLINLFSIIKVIDLSCGTGHFLKAIVKYFYKYVLSISPEIIREENEESIIDKLIFNIWGIDIDFIALHIAKLELVLLTGSIDNLEKINNHFIHGNALISCPNNMTKEFERIKLTSGGFLYHPSLSINSETLLYKLKEGYDLVVGNPPWEKLRFEEKSFFRSWVPKIASLGKKDERAKEISKLEQTHPLVFEYYKKFIQNLEASKEYIQKSNAFKYSSAGELNTYALFTELALSYLSPNGRVCYVVKSAIAVSSVNSCLFKHLLNNNLISHFYDFINRKNIFAIDNRERFCILILGKHNKGSFKYRSGLLNPEEVFLPGDLEITAPLLNILNPLTGMLPSVTNSGELTFLLKMHKTHPLLEEVFSDSKYGRLVHFTNHAQFIHKEPSKDVLPVYEGKFIELYDGRYSTFEGLSCEEKFSNKASSVIVLDYKKNDRNYLPQARYFIEKVKWVTLTKNYTATYSLMWRSLTSASNRRTCIATILPHMPTSQSIQFLQLNCIRSLTILLAIFNSVIFDYMVRLKLNGIDLTQKIIKQMVVPEKVSFEEEINFMGVKAKIYDHISVRIAALLWNDSRLSSFCEQIVPRDYPLYTLTDDRKRAIAEIDILIAKTYRVENSTFNLIIRSFPNFYSDKEIDDYFSL